LISAACVNKVQASPNHEARLGDGKVRLIVLHYTGMASGQAAVDWLCNPDSKVSCHYLVDVDGRVVQMVDETLRAWHAGVSQWHDIVDVNSNSIGIEIQNAGHAACLPAFPDVQMAAVIALCQDIMLRHGLGPEQVVGHSDVAPGRKIDPGEAFDWDMLAHNGIGLAVRGGGSFGGDSLQSEDAGPSVLALQQALRKFGYALEETSAFDARTRIVVEAFQRRFRQRCVDGVADTETQSILNRLLAITQSVTSV
jgi:N-acetylmuramoyl-L-alanine amidase